MIFQTFPSFPDVKNAIGFRTEKNDKFIKIEVDVKDLHEWTQNPFYPQKISFRKGKVIEIVKL